MQELITRLQNNDSRVTTVNLADQNVNVNLCMVICLALAKNTHVKYLDLSNNRLGTDGWAILSEMLKVNESLISLKLSNTLPENILYGNRYCGNDEAIKLLSSIIDSNLKLQELDISKNKFLCKNSLTHLARLMSYKPYFKRIGLAIDSSEFKENCYGLDLAVRKNKELIYVDLSKSNLTKINNMSSFLKSCFDKDSLSISLKDCLMQSKGMNEILSLLKQSNAQNIRLDLANNYFGWEVEAGFNLGLALSDINCLYSLSLDNTQFSKVNSTALHYGLMKNKSLRNISLNNNYQLETETTLEAIQSLLQKRLRDDFIILLLTVNQLIANMELSSDLWLYIVEYLDFSELNKTPEEKQACAKLILEENRTSLKTKLNCLPTHYPLVKEKVSLGKKLFYFFEQGKPASPLAEDGNEIVNQALKL